MKQGRAAVEVRKLQRWKRPPPYLPLDAVPAAQLVKCEVGRESLWAPGRLGQAQLAPKAHR